MKSVSALATDEARALRGVLFDLDDTLLTHGLLTRAAYDAMWALKDAGLRLLAVTENGAVVVARDGAGVARSERCDEGERRARRMRLARIIDEVRQVVPEARLTDDVEARRSDVTWDIGERVKLPEDRVTEIVRVIAREGARSFASSVHVHATFDTDDKASGTLRYLARVLGEDPGAATSARYAFLGDSGNDAACFGAFRVTFAVANVRAHLARIPVTPRYVSRGEMGDGFAEIAQEILARR